MCEDYGYIHNGCPGNFVACPFDANFKTCDEEAYQNDFKFALASGNAVNRDDWEKANTSGSVYENAFIVGRGGTGDKGVNDKNYCMPKAELPNGQTSLFPAAPGTSANATIPSHKHTGTFSFTPHQPSSKTFKQRRTGSNYYSNLISSLPTVSQTISCQDDGNRFTYPRHYRVDGYFYTYTPGKWNTAQAALPTSKPNCDNLGYKDSIEDCPGDYVVCPFDNAKVMCDMEAKAGEIKFSLQTADHDGWLLCDGRALSGIKVNGVSAANSELKSILNTSNLGTQLPGFKDKFLALRNEDDSMMEYYYQKIQDHTHAITYVSRATIYSAAGSGSVASPRSGGDQGKWGWACSGATSISLKDLTIELSEDTTCSSGCTVSTKLLPYHFEANMFIYTGKLNVD